MEIWQKKNQQCLKFYLHNDSVQVCQLTKEIFIPHLEEIISKYTQFWLGCNIVTVELAEKYFPGLWKKACTKKKQVENFTVIICIVQTNN